MRLGTWLEESLEGGGSWKLEERELRWLSEGRVRLEEGLTRVQSRVPLERDEAGKTRSKKGDYIKE